MATDNYLSLSTETQGFVREKASKFYAFAYPVTTVEEVEARLQEVGKQFHDARHICYAYRLGPKGEKHRANDAGEPAHSAGDPILNELKSKGVSDALCVVVRYFGGTKLGVGGLIRAYSDAAKDALSRNPVKEIYLTQDLQIRFAYARTADVNRVLHHQGWVVVERDFTDDCSMTLRVPQSKWASACDIFREMGILVREK